MKQVNNTLLLQLSGIFFIILLWYVITATIGKELSVFLATPIETISALYILFRSELIIYDTVFTLARTLFAFIPAVLSGVVVGLLLGTNRRIYIATEIPIEFFRSLPATAILPLFILAFGINDITRIGIAFFVSFWIIVINTIYGVNHTSLARRNFAITLKATKTQIFRYITMWEILPYVFSGMRIAISISLIIVIIAEMIIAPEYGLGIRLLNAQQTFKIDYLYGVILITGMLGFCINKILAVIESAIIHWEGN